MTDAPPCRYRATCRCGREVSSVAPLTDPRTARWIRCRACGAVCADDDRTNLRQQGASHD